MSGKQIFTPKRSKAVGTSSTGHPILFGGGTRPTQDPSVSSASQQPFSEECDISFLTPPGTPSEESKIGSCVTDPPSSQIVSENLHEPGVHTQSTLVTPMTSCRPDDYDISAELFASPEFSNLTSYAEFFIDEETGIREIELAIPDFSYSNHDRGGEPRTGELRDPCKFCMPKTSTETFHLPSEPTGSISNTANSTVLEIQKADEELVQENPEKLFSFGRSLPQNSKEKEMALSNVCDNEFSDVANKSKLFDLEQLYQVKANHDVTFYSPVIGEVCKVPTMLETLSFEKRLSISQKIFSNTLKHEAKTYLSPNHGGKEGEIIQLLRSYFRMELPHSNLYRYDVRIEESRSSKSSELNSQVSNAQSRSRIVSKLVKSCEVFRGLSPVFDGKNMLIREPIGFVQPFTVKMSIRKDNIMKYLVTVEPTRNQSCSIRLEPFHRLLQRNSVHIPEDAITALCLVLRYTCALWHATIMRSYFMPSWPEGAVSLGGEREMWKGYQQSLHIAQWKPFMKAMVEPLLCQRVSVLEFMEEILKKDLRDISEMEESDITRLTNELDDLKVIVTHLAKPRKYRILRVTSQCPSHMMCKIEEQEDEISVADYFFTRYAIKLQYPNLPCLQMKSASKATYFPIEMCYLAKNEYGRKLWANHTRNMVKMCFQPSEECFQYTHKIIEKTNSLVKVGINKSDIRDTVLEPPNVIYKTRLVVPTSAVWSLQNKRLLSGAVVGDWILLSFASSEECPEKALESFSSKLCRIANGIGMSLSDPIMIKSIDSEISSDFILSSLKSHYPTVTFVVVVLSKDDCRHEEIKYSSERIGIVTQGIKARNLRKRNLLLVLQNICQKINTKLGCVNLSLSSYSKSKVFDKPFMILGADISCIKGRKHWYTISSLVGSLDRHPSRFAVTASVHTSSTDSNRSVEGIAHLKDMTKKLLVAFSRVNRGLFPETIIFYRNGIAQGLFLQVLSRELPRLREACKEVGGESYQPGITYVILQKRARPTFISAGKDEVVQGFNVPPKTIVEMGVVNTFLFDFYICSPISLKETNKAARPVRYFIVWDDNEFPPDDVQKMTHYMCHLYSLCTRPISIPVPVQYAQLTILRSKQHLQSTNKVSSKNIGQRKCLLLQEMEEAIRMSDAIGTMYLI